MRLTSDAVSKAAIQPYPSPLPEIADKENGKNDDSDSDDSSSDSTVESEEPTTCTRAHSLPTVPGGLVFLLLVIIFNLKLNILKIIIK